MVRNTHPEQILETFKTEQRIVTESVHIMVSLLKENFELVTADRICLIKVR